MLQGLVRLVSIAALLPPLAAAGGQEMLVDGIAAQVGTRIVLISEVMRAVAPQEAALRSMHAPETEIARLRADGLERMIERKLIEDVVQRMELYASDEEVSRTIESIARENGLSTEQLYASVTFHGMNEQDYRDQIKRDLEQRNVVNALVGSQINIEEPELLELYQSRFADQPTGGETVHVRQLLVTHGARAKRTAAAACAVVDAARVRVLAGEDFPTVAAEISEVAPLDGGDIGWLHMDSAAPWMKLALSHLAPGQTSDVLELPFGCCILNLVERRAFEPIEFEQAKNSLSQELWEQKMERGYREWIEELRSRTYLDRRGYFADAARLEGLAPLLEPAIP